jgi:hypothetical protein
VLGCDWRGDSHLHFSALLGPGRRSLSSLSLLLLLLLSAPVAVPSSSPLPTSLVCLRAAATTVDTHAAVCLHTPRHSPAPAASHCCCCPLTLRVVATRTYAFLSLLLRGVSPAIARTYLACGHFLETPAEQRQASQELPRTAAQPRRHNTTTRRSLRRTTARCPASLSATFAAPSARRTPSLLESSPRRPPLIACHCPALRARLR